MPATASTEPVSEPNLRIFGHSFPILDRMLHNDLHADITGNEAVVDHDPEMKEYPDNLIVRICPFHEKAAENDEQ